MDKGDSVVNKLIDKINKGFSFKNFESGVLEVFSIMDLFKNEYNHFKEGKSMFKSKQYIAEINLVIHDFISDCLEFISDSYEKQKEAISKDPLSYGKKWDKDVDTYFDNKKKKMLRETNVVLQFYK